uniref:RING-type domain-containing protein n=1 Tax=Globisporangium ultimum (strain ATCC 200006 / CBS 805.95 / DAOM BR144) TaxID=431595 RepID=K3X9Z6_GLOUD
MSLGNRLELAPRDDGDGSSVAQDEGEWASRFEDTVETLDAAVAIVSNGEREWDAAAGAQVSVAAHHRSESVLSQDSSRSDAATELAVLGDTCPICLQGLADSVMVQSCYHVYCFECLSMWVQSLALHGIDPATCPLCKAQFDTIYTNVVSEFEYDLFRFHGRNNSQLETSTSSIMRRRQHKAQKEQQKLQRRSLVYRKRMRLAKVNATPVDLDGGAYPKILKVKGEYDVWLHRELQACIGRDIDLTVLISLIQCCLDKMPRSDPTKGYRELHAALQPFLYEDTEIFVREFAFFLGSRLNLDAGMHDGIMY